MAAGQYLVVLMCMIMHNVNGHGNSGRAVLSLIGSSPPGVTTFGSNDRELSTDYLPSSTIFLANRIPTEGILYMVEPYFITTDPVFIQLWYQVNETTNTYKLVFQKEVSSDVAKVKKAIQFSTDYDNTCPLVNDDMFLGAWSPSGARLPIGVYYQEYGTGSELYESFFSSSNPPYISQTRTFYQSSYPSALALKGYVYNVDQTVARRKRTPTAPCPLDLLTEPPLPPTTTTTTTTTATTTTTTTTTTTAVEPKSEPGGPITVSDSVTYTEDDGREFDNTSNSGLINKNIVYVISGVAAAVVFILVVIIVCCVMKRRRPSNPTITITSPATGDEKQKSHHRPDGVQYQRTNRGYVPDQTAYERPLPAYQGRAHEYASMAPATPSGVYEEIVDGDTKRESSKRRGAGDTGQRSDETYLKPGDGRYVSAGSYLHTTKPPKHANLQVVGDVKHGGKVKDDGSREGQSPYLELEIDTKVGKYGYQAKR